MIKKTPVDKLAKIVLHCEKRIDELELENHAWLQREDAIEVQVRLQVYEEILDMITNYKKKHEMIFK
jgi:hypothetical protein